jgi:hypothetical protein
MENGGQTEALTIQAGARYAKATAAPNYLPTTHHTTALRDCFVFITPQMNIKSSAWSPACTAQQHPGCFPQGWQQEEESKGPQSRCVFEASAR